MNFSLWYRFWRIIVPVVTCLLILLEFLFICIDVHLFHRAFFFLLDFPNKFWCSPTSQPSSQGGRQAVRRLQPCSFCTRLSVVSKWNEVRRILWRSLVAKALNICYGRLMCCVVDGNQVEPITFFPMTRQISCGGSSPSWHPVCFSGHSTVLVASVRCWLSYRADDWSTRTCWCAGSLGSEQ